MEILKVVVVYYVLICVAVALIIVIAQCVTHKAIL